MLVQDSSFPPLLQDFIDLDGLRQNFGTVILLIFTLTHSIPVLIPCNIFCILFGSV